MSSKDEINKIIAEETVKLEAQDRINTERHERQCLRFQPMRFLLQEIVSSVDSDYLEASIREWSATLELGDKKRSSCSHPYIRWHIEPNKEHVFFGEGVPFTKDKQGVLIIERTNHYYLPEPEIEETQHVFATEIKAAEFLMAVIGRQIARYRHAEIQRAKSAEKK
jgi:hypothetical protein